MASRHDEVDDLKLYLFAPGLNVKDAARFLHGAWQDATYDIAKGYANYDRDELPKKLQHATVEQIGDWVCDDVDQVSSWLGDNICDYIGSHTSINFNDENYDVVYNAILRACVKEFGMSALYAKLEKK